MHGSIQLEHSRFRSLRRSCSRHMRSVLPLVKKNSSVVIEGERHSSPASSAVTTTSDSFFKDGRKISVGDCALFKPTQGSPPYIGLIRYLRFDADNIRKLGVNWLYRSAEIKLGKGTLLEGAPNEIFYSFHKDEVPAASLLHPCKVAFLPKGVELPTGTASFVCRRVYDIANRCLWWLTDQDYMNDRQEEVDQLLCKTRLEMHAPLQSGSRSPKQVNGPASTSHVKSVSDSGQNSSIASHAVMKGKKREKGDHGSEHVKKERCLRSDDNVPVQCKTEINLKSEISRITEKGGLVDLEGAEKLVQLMQLDKTEGKMDLVSRTIVAGVMAATNKADCLDRFVQLRGLTVLDEWLQDIHKAKLGDSNSLKESDVSIDEFLLVLLRALDKLPVDLQALQMCNIGRSVNLLRSHKNSDIQRKARSLVETWKKRVEAEMITNEEKSGSTQAVSGWPSKSRAAEAAPHSGGRTPTGSDVAMKSSITQSSTSKTASARVSHVDSAVKSATLSPAHIKPASSPSTVKENLIRVPAECPPDVPLVREDRSSSSNQSHNQSQSSVKEEPRTNFASLATVNKASITSTRNRKACSFSSTSVSGIPKEMNKGKSSSMNKNSTLEKLNRSSSNAEKVLDVNEGSSHKLIVKIPNRVRSPAQGVTAGPQEESTYTNSRVSSPAPLDKHEHTLEEKADVQACTVASEINVDSVQNSDSKDVPPPPLLDEGQSMISDSTRSSQGQLTNLLKSSKMHASSFSPMSALMSCVKYSESNSSLSLDDDVGMNLLASVAAGEISRSDLLSPSDSTEQSTPAAEDVSRDDGEKSKSVSDNKISSGQAQFSNGAEGDDKNQAAALDGKTCSQGGISAGDAPNDVSRGKKPASSYGSEDLITSDNNKQHSKTNAEVRCKLVAKVEINEKSNENSESASLTRSASEKLRHEFVENTYEDKAPVSNGMEEDVAEIKAIGVVSEEKPSCLPTDSEEDARKTVEGSSSSPTVINGGKCKKEAATDDPRQTAPSEKPLCGASDENRAGENIEKGVEACGGSLPEVERNAAAVEIDGLSCSYHASDEAKNHDNNKAVVSENKKADNTLHNLRPSSSSKHDALQKTELKASSSDSVESNEEGGNGEVAESSEMDTTKMEFDLNEGFNGDEGKYGGEPVSLMPSGGTMNSLAFSVNPVPRGHSASVTVAAAAKGFFVPPDDLLKGKGCELGGWRGSAATSAFRPAEPRKLLETPLVSTSILSMSDALTSEHGRVALDFDLNVPDERVLEEIASREAASSCMKPDFGYAKFLNEPSSISVPPGRSSGGVLDLDLNRVDDASDAGNFSRSSGFRKGDIIIPALNLKPFEGYLAADGRRDLDLNNGPAGVEEAGGGNAEQFSIHQQIKVGIMPPPPQISAAGLRMNSPAGGQGNFSSWFPPGISFSTAAFPSMLPDRGGEHQFSVFPPSAAAQRAAFAPHSAVTSSFASEIYRGSVLPSSPAVPFQSGSFQFPIYPFGAASYPLPSATLPVGAASYVDSSPGSRLYVPPIHSQLLGPVAAPQFQRPYMVALQDGGGGVSNTNTTTTANNNSNDRRWVPRQGFDLNAGPVVTAESSEAREEMFSMVSGSSQALNEEQQQGRMYSAGKRKEPDGGWDGENSIRFKQSSWQ